MRELLVDAAPSAAPGGEDAAEEAGLVVPATCGDGSAPRRPARWHWKTLTVASLLAVAATFAVAATIATVATQRGLREPTPVHTSDAIVLASGSPARRQRRRRTSTALDGDVVGASVEAVVGVAAFGKELAEGEVSPATAGSALSSIGAVIGLAVPPPAGLVIGGILGVAGGIVSLFEPEGPSIEDVLEQMEAGFKRVEQKLDAMSVQLGDIRRVCADMAAKLDEVYELLRDHLELGVGDLRDLNADFLHAWTEYQYAVQHPGSSSGFVDHVQRYHQKWASSRHGRAALSPANVRQLVRTKNKCEAGEIYKQILAGRFELYFFASTDMNMQKKGSQSLRELQKLHQDLKDYVDAIREVYGEHEYENVLKSWEYSSLDECEASCVASDCVMRSKISWEGSWCLRHMSIRDMSTSAFFLAACDRDMGGQIDKHLILGPQGHIRDARSRRALFCQDLHWADSDQEAKTCTDYEREQLCTAEGELGAQWKPEWGKLSDYATDGIAADNACCACGGGSISQRFPVPCRDFRWVDSFKYTCADYESNQWCTADGGLGANWKPEWGKLSDYATDGIAADSACCACGGGSTGQRFDVPCRDLHWVDSFNYTCADYESNQWCTADGELGAQWKTDWGTLSDYATDGFAADNACCACGGGSSQPFDQRLEHRWGGVMLAENLCLSAQGDVGGRIGMKRLSVKIVMGGNFVASDGTSENDPYVECHIDASVAFTRTNTVWHYNWPVWNHEHEFWPWEGRDLWCYVYEDDSTWGGYDDDLMHGSARARADGKKTTERIRSGDAWLEVELQVKACPSAVYFVEDGSSGPGLLASYANEMIQHRPVYRFHHDPTLVLFFDTSKREWTTSRDYKFTEDHSKDSRGYWCPNEAGWNGWTVIEAVGVNFSPCWGPDLSPREQWEMTRD